MKKLFFLFFVLPLLGVAGEVKVTSVTAQQQYPRIGLVDVIVTLQGSAEDMASRTCTFVATNSATKAEISVEHITRNGDDTGSGNVWTRKFIWDARTDVGAVKIDDVALTVDLKPLGSVQLWEGGPYWAECNVGASQPEEYGYYFWWGDTVGYKRNANDDGWRSVKDSTSFSFGEDNCPTSCKSISQLKLEEFVDETGNLVAAHDAAAAHLGAPWRMPTDAEFSALISNCTTTWITRNGVSGRLVTGKGTYLSKSIFLPDAGYGYESFLGSYGYYLSSSPDSGDSDYAWDYAWNLHFTTTSFHRAEYCRFYGQSVRPVRGYANPSAVSGGVTTHIALDCSVIGFDQIAVTSVTARQRYPWNGLVDITVTIQGAAEDVANTICTFAATNSATKSAIPVAHVMCNGDDEGSGNAWTRKYIWDAKADVGAEKIDDVALSVDLDLGVQLWEGGPYWAECNVGATKPEGCGYYFWWGNTVGYKRNASNDGWVSVEDETVFSFNSRTCPTFYKDTWQLEAEEYMTGRNLAAAHDAATAHLGEPWRMPTIAEFSALINNCDTEWTSRNGVPGRLVKGRGAYASKNIFLPAAGYGYDTYHSSLGWDGYYWSSTTDLGTFYDAWYLHFYSDVFSGDNFDDRSYGRSVRPVRGFDNAADVMFAGFGVTANLALDCREGMREISADGEELRYDASWYANADSVQISENGTVVKTGDSGTYNWQLEPSCTTRYVLKLEAFVGNQVVTNEIAEFVDSAPALDHTGVVTNPAVEPTSSQSGTTAEIKCSHCGEVLAAAEAIPALGYIRNVTARQLWPHKKVEVCYEIAEDVGEVAGENAMLVLTCGNNTAKTVLGDTRCVPGLHRVVWDMEADGVAVNQLDAKFAVGYGEIREVGAKEENRIYTYLGYIPTKKTLLWGGIKVSDIVGVIGFFKSAWVTNPCDVPAYNLKLNGTTLTAQFQLEEGGDCTKCVGVEFTDGDDGVHGRAVYARYRSGAGYLESDFDVGSFSSCSIGTSDSYNSGYGVKNLRASVRCVAPIGVDVAKGVSAPIAINTSSSVKDGMSVAGVMTLGYSPIDAREVELQVDGTTVLSSAESGEFAWMPLSLGTHTLKHIVGNRTWTRTVNVTELAFATPIGPNPPTEANANIAIRQASHSFAVEGGAYSIPTVGVNGYTGSFAVSKSDDWITINSAEVNWKAGRSIVYTVAANEGAEERTGYVYVGGHVHTITQTGIGAKLSSYSTDVEAEGWEGCFTVLADAGISWNARPNVDWITISPTTGTGEKDVIFTVAPWNDVAIRSATITVAGETFTVNQIGQRMKLDESVVTVDYNAQTVELSVSALPFVEWDAGSSVSWISIANGSEGKGEGIVTLAVAENPNYLPRTAFVRIGTEMVTISQTKRSATALNFTINPVQTAASATGGTDVVDVTATPGLPWSVQSEADWIILSPSTITGAGSDGFSYIVEPNSAMTERSGTIKVSPETASGLAAKTIVIVQAAAEISEEGHEFAAKGEAFEMDVSVADGVKWSVAAVPDWVTIEGGTTRTGPGVLRVTAKENLSIGAREATIIIAGRGFKITQSGRTVRVDPSMVGAPMSGGDGAISVIADANVIWSASPSDLWISIWGDDDYDYDADGNIVDVGSGVVNYYIDGCEKGESPRIGWIQIGDKRVNILQTCDGVLVSVVDDPGASVVGDVEKGFVIKPSERNTAVEVTIPQGVDAAKVTVEVSPKVASVKPNGAKVKIVSGDADITGFLNMPAADGNGIVDLTKAIVKEEIVKEALDIEKGAKIELDAANPSLTTPNTRKGLFYQLREGATLDGMSNGDSTIGDGNPWKPEIKVKGGNSAFYSIGVGKGK